MEYTANFLDVFIQGAAAGMARIQPFAERLVAILATLSIVLTFAIGALRRDFDPVATLVGKILLIGIVVWFVTSWPELLDNLIEGAVFLGSTAGGGGDPGKVMQPLAVVGWGWDFAQLCFNRAADLTSPVGFFTDFVIIVTLLINGFVVAFAYLIIGVTIAVALVEFWVGSTVALVLLPFAVFKPMAFIAQSTFGWVAANAIRLLLLSTIVTLGADAFDVMALVEPSADEITGEVAFAGTVVAVFLLTLTLSAQRMALGLINGAPQLGGGAVFGAIGAAAVTSHQSTRATIGTGKAIYSVGRAVLSGVGRGGSWALGKLGVASGNQPKNSDTGKEAAKKDDTP